MWGLMHDYQQRRVLTLLYPSSDPLGAGYHIIQSTIAIGSGGLFGKGWMNGIQSKLEFLPERHTDFIFAVIGEEFGYAGAILLVGLYLAIAARAHRRPRADPVRAADGSRLSLNLSPMCSSTWAWCQHPAGMPLPMMSYGTASSRCCWAWAS
jgi:rod shape determining protein RodA